ncbi:hypothetical protein [Paenibacillus tepidiphilus]|uniref:hypothetical protein n=1 Tax=Paenibacillus tepidiphilus TaxID=2608683 RepID=UPI0012386DBD|nr:hypothetical protein [Paenibacillus tepidiphilus]
MDAQKKITKTMEMVKKVLMYECPYITLNEDNNEAQIILHYQPRNDLPRVECVTYQKPQYVKGRIYLKDQSKLGYDPDNLEFALDVIESRLYQQRPNAGSIVFQFNLGCITDIENKNSYLYMDSVGV